MPTLPALIPFCLYRWHVSPMLRLLCTLLVVSVLPATSRAAGVVTTPTEAALVAAMQGGGMVTFACDGVIHLTKTNKVGPGTGGDGTTTLTLDATGHNITLDGGGSVQFLNIVTGGILGGSSPYELTFTHLTLANGSASSGGAVSVQPSTTWTMTDCTFINNRSTGSGGGAIYVQSNATLTITNCTFANNQAIGSGGAILVDCGFNSYNVTVTNSLFSGNAIIAPLSSVSSPGHAMGGAMYVSCNSAIASGGICAFTNCAFVNNQITAGANTGVNGGALMLSTTDGVVTNCTFCGNSITSGRNNAAHGGALCCSYALSHTYTVVNCTVANNNAVGGPGGTSSGGGIYNDTDGDTFHRNNVVLTNTLVAGNTASAPSNNSYGLLTDNGHNLCSDGSCAFTNPTSLNNTNPRLGNLVYTGGGVPTLSLLANSPAIDAGDDSQAPLTDARGATRQGSHSDIGAYERPVWQADASAAAPDGTTRLLWNRSNGLLNLWSVDGSGNVVQSFDFGPFPGWTAVALSIGSDNNTRLLWQHSSGAIDLWKVDTGTGSGAVLSSTHFGPFAGWTLNMLSTGADNHTRLLWRNQDGHIDVWNVDTGTGTDAATLLSTTHFGPYASWTATGLAVGSDNHTRLLWSNLDGRANVWNVDTGAGIDAATQIASAHYGPYAGWTATTLSVGADNNTRLLWNHVNGTLNLWNLQIGAGTDHSALLSSPAYGPYTGWTATTLSVGADNQARLLWNRTDGLLDLWRVNGSGGLLSSFHFGPF